MKGGAELEEGMDSMERGSSVVERRTRNQVSPSSNPPLIPGPTVETCTSRALPDYKSAILLSVGPIFVNKSKNGTTIEKITRF